MTSLGNDILDLPVSGVNLGAATLGGQIHSADLTVLVFLRHLGCIFCKETVRDLRAASEADPSYPQVVFVGQGDLEESRSFAEKLWPAMSIVSDPGKTFYTAMGLGKGSLYQMFGPSVWACGLRAMVKGNLQTRIVGDLWTMPGAFAVDRRGMILWHHDFENIGDHPNWKSLPAELRSAAQNVAALTPAASPI